MIRNKTLKTIWDKKSASRLMSLFMTFTLVLSLITISPAEKVSADIINSGECGTNAVWEITDNGADTYKLTIKATGEGSATNNYGTPTGKTAVPWVEYLTKITEFEVQSGVTYLGDRLCYGATALEKINIATTVTGTGNGLFRDCTSLETGVIPGAVTTMVDNLFYGCKLLKEVTLGDGTTVIGRNMVNGGCTSLKILNIPESITTFGETPFKGTSIETINYGGTMGNYKLLLETAKDSDVSPLKNASITVNCSDGTWHYGEPIEIDGATSGTTGDLNWNYDKDSKELSFEGNGSMADYNEINGNDTPWSAMMSEISSINLASGISKIGNNAFYGAIALNSITIPEGVTSIGVNAFNSCTNLNTLTIPESITDIGTDAISNTNITTINYGGTIEEYKSLITSVDASELLKNDNITVNCSDGTYKYQINKISGSCGANVNWELTNNGDDTYKLTLHATAANAKTNDYGTPTGPTAVPWAKYITQITEFTAEPGIVYLGNRLCYGASSLKKITIPETVTGTGNGLFRACTSLTEAVIPGAVTNMIDNLFYACSNLQKVTIGEGTTVLGRNMVNGGCTSLEELNFPGSVTTINETALNGLTNLTTINYSGTIEQYKKLLDLEYGAPLKNANITVNCSDGEYQWGINGNAGENIKYSLNEITGVLTISGSGAMLDYPTITSAPWNKYSGKINTVLFMDGITHIGKNAFSKCYNIQNVYYLLSDENWKTLKSTAGTGNEPLFAAANIASKRYGKCGDNADWKLSDDLTILTISGFGDMYDFTTQPWCYTAKNIEKIIVEQGVTYIGDNAFSGLKKLTDVQLASSVKGTGTFSIKANTSLTEIKLPEGFEVIGSKSFEACSNLSKIYLPASLKVIDMKAFLSCAHITDVYYSGTKEQWNKIELSNSADGNATLKNANIHFMGTNKDVSSVYTDVPAKSPYHDGIQYMVDNGYMNGTGNIFGTDDIVNIDDILTILYNLSGSSAVYSSAREWAISNNIIDETFNNAFTGSDLKRILNQMAIFNGFDSYTDSTADDTVITKGIAASSLSSFIQSSCGKADRFDKITSQVKDIISKGGDGNMYVIAVNLFTANVATKPGDCTFIIFPNGQTMMIDFGASNYEANVLRFLQGASITNLDYFVITHPHGDHYGNAMMTAQYIFGSGGKIGNFIYTGVNSKNNAVINNIAAYLESNGSNINTNVRAGSVINIGGVTINVYSPFDSEINPNDVEDLTNNASLTMKFTYGTSTYLTCGDLYISKELSLINEYGSQLRADVVKLNHHGAYTSNSEAWIKNLRAKIAFVEDADNGSHYTCKKFSSYGTQYYSAGLDQTVMVKMDNSRNYSVITGTDSTLRKYYNADKLDDLNSVENVENLIEQIGAVTVNSKDSIERALKAYASLSDEQKSLVYADKLKVLNEAKNTYDKLTGENQSSTTEPPTTGSENVETPTTKPNVEIPTTSPVKKPVKKIKVGKAKILKITRSKNNKKAKIQLKKIKGVTGYKIKYSVSRKLKNSKTVTSKSFTKTIKRLRPGKKYFIKVRAYRLINHKIYYGKWTKIKILKVRK